VAEHPTVDRERVIPDLESIGMPLASETFIADSPVASSCGIKFSALSHAPDLARTVDTADPPVVDTMPQTPADAPSWSA
jgi:hypothetical protein